MAITQEGTGTETAAERNARLQAAFNRASASTPAVPRLNYNVQDIQGQQQTTARATHLDVPYEQFKANIDVQRPWDRIEQPLTPKTTTTQEIERRRYTIPQFGEQPDNLYGISGTLNSQQLAEAARLTGDAMFTYGQLPDVISIDVARELPYNPTSELFQQVMMDSFGVPGFDTADEFLAQLGYQEYEDGKWEILDPITVTGYGDAVYQGGGISPSSGAGTSAARGGQGYRQGGSLINWRIGF